MEREFAATKNFGLRTLDPATRAERRPPARLVSSPTAATRRAGVRRSARRKERAIRARKTLATKQSAEHRLGVDPSCEIRAEWMLGSPPLASGFFAQNFIRKNHEAAAP